MSRRTLAVVAAGAIVLVLIILAATGVFSGSGGSSSTPHATTPPGGAHETVVCDIDALNALLRGEVAAVETYDQVIGKFDGHPQAVELQRIRTTGKRIAGRAHSACAEPDARVSQPGRAHDAQAAVPHVVRGHVDHASLDGRGRIESILVNGIRAAEHKHRGRVRVDDVHGEAGRGGVQVD